VGEWVVAIGAPRGLDQTVTQGIISAKHRQGISDPSSYQDFLQTDAAINPGNSGGPMFNLQGQVIGVNAVIISESGGFEGIGFTIPSNIATHVVKALIAHGKVERGWLGVEIRDLTPELAKKVNAAGKKGVLVANVAKGGPAEKAGMKKNDVIVAFGGKEVSDSAILRNQVADSPIGQEAKIVVLRNGQREELTVSIGNLDSASKVLAGAIKERLGVEVRAVTPREVQKYNMDNNQGVVITKVEIKGVLGEAGFEVGDIILGIDNQPITGLDEFIALISALQPKQKITILALDHRTGSIGNVEVTVK
jgi:serine protease Do